MDLESLFKNIISSGIRLSNPETIRKIRILNGFQLFFIMIAPLLGLFYFYIGAIFLFYVIVIAGLLMIPSIILLRKTKSITWLGNYAIFVLWATVLILSWNGSPITHDGVMGPLWMLNAGLVLLALFLNGYLWGTVWAAFVFVETGITVYLFRAGYSFPNLIPHEISAIYSLGTYSISLLILLIFAFLFEREKDEALVREREKSQAVRESRRYIEDILARSPTPTFVVDKNHRIIQWNRACQQMTGIAPEEILGKEVWQGFTIDSLGSMADILLEDPHYIERNYDDVSKTDSGWFELEMFLPGLKGGQRVTITVAPILDENGELRGAIQTIQEMKNFRHGGEVLAEKDLPSQIEEFSTNPIFKINSQGKVCYWSRTCEEILGFSSSEMLGKNPLSFVSKGSRPRFKKVINKAFSGEAAIEKEWKYYGSKGRAVYVLASVFPLKATDGRDKECVVVNTNITDFKMKMKKLEIYALETKEKLKTISEEYDLLKKNIATFIRKKEDE